MERNPIEIAPVRQGWQWIMGAASVTTGRPVAAAVRRWILPFATL